MGVGRRGSGCRGLRGPGLSSGFTRSDGVFGFLAAVLEDNATFICGHPKSGTSLVRGMLDSHPQLIVFPEETKFFRRVLPETAGRGMEEAAGVVEDRILQIFQWSAASPSPSQVGFLDRDYGHLAHEAVKAAYRKRLKGWTGESSRLLSAAILAYGDVSGRLGPDTLRWVEKSPYNERHAGRIFGWWPEARCLHVVRDPRDNYASYRKKHPDWSPEAFAFSWLRSTRRGWRNQKQFGIDRYWILRYEDLILATDQTIARMVDFLGVEEAQALRSPTRDGRPWKGNSMFGETFDGISARPLGRFAEELSEADTRRLERLLEPEMARLGYSLARPLASGDRFAGIVGRVKGALRSTREDQSER